MWWPWNFAGSCALTNDTLCKNFRATGTVVRKILRSQYFSLWRHNLWRHQSNFIKFCKNVQLNKTYLVVKFQTHRYFSSKVIAKKQHFLVKFRTKAENSARRQRAIPKTFRFSESSTLCASVSRQRIWSSSSPSQLKFQPKMSGVQFRKYIWRHNSWRNHVTGTKFCT